MAALVCPYYTVPGNHDIRGEGAQHYRSRLSPEDYYFDYGGFRFIFVDSSSLGLTDAQLFRLQENLTGAPPGFVFLHVPPLDPRVNNHAFLDPGQAEAFMELVSAPPDGCRGLLGTYPYVSPPVISGVHHVVSGGGGAAPMPRLTRAVTITLPCAGLLRKGLK